MDANPPQSSPIPSKALLSPRPNSHIAHPYPQSDKGGEIGKSRPHSPSKCFLSREGEGEGAGELSLTEKSWQGNLGSHPASAGRISILLSVRSLTSCPLAARPLGPARQLPSRGHRDPTCNLRSGRARNRPPFIKVCHGPTAYDPLPFPYADAYTQRQQGGPHDLARSREPLPYNAGSALQSSPVC